MTPKEKAEELVDKFKLHSYYDAHDLTPKFRREESNVESAVECALIAVDELIKQESKYNNGSFYPSNYWSEVKAEIEML